MGWGLCPLPRNKRVPSPVPKYTKMATHRDSPVYSHFSILGQMASPVYSLNQIKSVHYHIRIR